MKKNCCACLCKLTFALGFVSVIASIAIWFLQKGATAEAIAHAERFGIFVGLWAPTFFALSACLHLYKNSCCSEKKTESCCQK